ncbi:ATP synthase subunit C [Acholeplasma sp. OttesenSCG-928-E16]|nr:ATP synthase subunit C [Acholeplasma sp. OttesenSCG-928-E16]
MLGVLEIVVPLVLVIAISIPLINVFRGKTDGKTAKKRMITHVFSFFIIITGIFLYSFLAAPSLHAAEGDTVSTEFASSMARGLGFLSAALATGFSSLGAGIAVAAAAPAAIGAFSENEKNFGKSMIFVVLGEGVAIYGVLISILIINQLSV